MIATPLDLTLTSSSPKVIQQKENFSDDSVKNNKSHIVKTEDYISKKYDEVALQHLKLDLLKEVNNEVPCESAVNSNDSHVIALKKHIESLQS